MGHKFSPSQISTFNDCPRKWFYGSIVRLPRSQHPSAAKGEKVHTILENYLRTGILAAPETLDGPELAAIAESGIKHLPDPKHFKIDLEGSWSFDRQTKGELALIVPTIHYNGRKDLEYDAADSIWTVGDHKTTSNLKYALTAEQLATDPQGILYGAQAIQAQGRDKVRLTWIYYHTKRPYKSRLVEVVLSEDHVETELQKLDEIVGRKMLPLVDKDLPPSQVEPNLTSCDKYGGCPYREICDVSPVARLRHAFTRFDVPNPENPLGIPKEEGSNEMNILERLKAQKAAQAKTGTESAEPTPNVNPPESTEAKAPELVEAKAPDPEPEGTPAPEKAKRTRGPNKPKEAPTPETVPAEPTPEPSPLVPGTTPIKVVLLIDTSPVKTNGQFSFVDDATLYSDAHKALKVDNPDYLDYGLIDYGKGAGMFAVVFAEALDATIQKAQDNGWTEILVLASSCSREFVVAGSIMKSRASVVFQGV